MKPATAVALAVAAALVGLGCLRAAGLIPTPMDLKAALLADDEAARRAEAGRAPPRRYVPPARDEGAAMRERMVAEATAGPPSQPPVPLIGAGDWGVSDVYLVLDSWQKRRDSRAERGEMAWDVVTTGAALTGAVYTRAPIENVIEVEVSAFRLPFLKEPPIVVSENPAINPPEVVPVPYGTGLITYNWHDGAAYPREPAYPAEFVAAYPDRLGWPHSSWSQLTASRMAIGLAEAGEQAHKGAAGNNFHLLFDVGYSPAGVADAGHPTAQQRAVPIVGRYVFTDPLRSLPSLSLRFYNPDRPIVFEPDVIFDALYSEPGAPDVISGIPGIESFYVPGHNLREGDRIFIRNARIDNAILRDAMTRAEGFLVHLMYPPNVPPMNPDVVPATSPDYFRLSPVPIWQSSLGPGTIPSPFMPPFYCDIYVARRRLHIPVRVRQLLPRKTQEIVPV